MLLEIMEHEVLLLEQVVVMVAPAAVLHLAVAEMAAAVLALAHMDIQDPTVGHMAVAEAVVPLSHRRDMPRLER
jgi:hypothetical protein